MSIELKVGEWYETRVGSRVRTIADIRDIPVRHDIGDIFVVVWRSGLLACFHPNGAYTSGDHSPDDIVKHLPDCTGWDWVEPKPEVWRDATPEDAIKKSHLRCRTQLPASGMYAYGTLVGYYVDATTPMWVLDIAGEIMNFHNCQVLDE